LFISEPAMSEPQPKFRRRAADRPGEIVQAAMAIFAEKGFAAARLDDIAARAGVGPGTVDRHFPSFVAAHDEPDPDRSARLLAVLADGLHPPMR
ncbi:MAG: TetR/AcrR family transcriptional regulator, partial [Actinomycetes bacterium]